MIEVKDRNGVVIKPGQKVLVHQLEGVKEATVVKVFPNNPTLNEPGYWVDIAHKEGVEGMMSYCLEVTP